MLDGTFIGRNGFLYREFVRAALNSKKGNSVNATHLCRAALEHGAEEKSRDVLLRKLRIALDSAAGQKYYKRHKIKGKQGYFFKAIVETEHVSE